jgi:hypothetical protein
LDWESSLSDSAKKAALSAAADSKKEDSGDIHYDTASSDSDDAFGDYREDHED